MLKIKELSHIILFGLAFAMLFQNAQKLLQGAPVEGAFNPYGRVEMFYQETHEPDVVIIGSSLAFEHFNPLIMFEEQGFTSYVFSAPMLDIQATDLYIKEAIKVYHPRVIVLESGKLTEASFQESWPREWLDPIPFSLQKLETIRFILDLQEEYGSEKFDSFLSFIFPLIRYHSRWKTLSDQDFALDWDSKYYHGAIHYHGHGSYYTTQPQSTNHYCDSIELDEELITIAQEKFECCVEICRENNIELLLVQTPSPGIRKVQHDLVAEWATKAGVSFLDYIEGELVEVNPETDYRNSWHLNDLGSSKLTHNFGQYMKENYDLPDHRSDPDYADWDYDWQVYQQDKASYYLSHENDWAGYLEKLQNPNYTVYLTVRDNLGGDNHPELSTQLQKLGLKSNFASAGLVGYIAVIDKGKVVYEQIKDAPIAHTVEINGQHVEIISESYRQGNQGSIMINGVEHFVDHRGLGIVVYDNLLEDIVDCVTFDLYGNGKACR